MGSDHGRLPLPPTLLIGREMDLADMAGEFADRVAFVDLSPLRDPDLVGPTIARALGGAGPGDAHARLAGRSTAATCCSSWTTWSTCRRPCPAWPPCSLWR